MSAAARKKRLSTMPIDTRIRLGHIACTLAIGQPLDDDDRAFLARALQDICDGEKADKALGLIAPSRGNLTDPDSARRQQREVVDAIIVLALRESLSVEAATDRLAELCIEFPDPRAEYRGTNTARTSLSKERLDAIWRAGTSEADRLSLKAAVAAQKKSLANSNNSQ